MKDRIEGALRRIAIGASLALTWNAAPLLAQEPGLDAPEAQAHEYLAQRVLDSRYRHNRYYPPLGFAISALPPDSLTVPGGDDDGEDALYFAQGAWYRQEGPARYVAVSPPIGITVPVLPPYYTTIQARGVPYFYADNVYYLQSPQGYLVVDPPPSELAVEEPPAKAAGEVRPRSSAQR